jgi:hypothetical protein
LDSDRRKPRRLMVDLIVVDVLFRLSESVYRLEGPFKVVFWGVKVIALELPAFARSVSGAITCLIVDLDTLDFLDLEALVLDSCVSGIAEKALEIAKK